jgi:hypothetical protein
MVGKAHDMWRTNCDCGDCSYCNGISYAAQPSPDCGACPGDGTTCPHTCRLADGERVDSEGQQQ